VLVGLLEDAPDRYGAPAQLLRYLNDRLESRLPEEMFVTMFYGVLDLRTGVVTYASGGHEPPACLRAGGWMEHLTSGGFPLGAFPETDYEEFTVRLDPGDTLFCYTDGLTDQLQSDGTRIGDEGLRELLAGCVGMPGAEILATALQGATGGSSALADDITAVAVHYLGWRVGSDDDVPAPLTRSIAAPV